MRTYSSTPSLVTALTYSCGREMYVRQGTKCFGAPRKRRTSENSVKKLSEKGLRSLRCSLTEHRNGTFRPIFASLRLPNPRSECCLYPFSDSFMAKFTLPYRPTPVGPRCLIGESLLPRTS